MPPELSALLGGPDAQISADWVPKAPAGMRDPLDIGRSAYYALDKLIPGLELNPARAKEPKQAIAMGNRAMGPSLLSLFSGEHVPYEVSRRALDQGTSRRWFDAPQGGNPPYQARYLDNANARIDRINEANGQWNIPPIQHESPGAPNAPLTSKQAPQGDLPIGMQGMNDARRMFKVRGLLQDLLSGSNP